MSDHTQHDESVKYMARKSVQSVQRPKDGSAEQQQRAPPEQVVNKRYIQTLMQQSQERKQKRIQSEEQMLKELEELERRRRENSRPASPKQPRKSEPKTTIAPPSPKQEIAASLRRRQSILSMHVQNVDDIQYRHHLLRSSPQKLASTASPGNKNRLNDSEMTIEGRAEDILASIDRKLAIEAGLAEPAVVPSTSTVRASAPANFAQQNSLSAQLQKDDQTVERLMKEHDIPVLPPRPQLPAHILKKLPTAAVPSSQQIESRTKTTAQRQSQSNSSASSRPSRSSAQIPPQRSQPSPKLQSSQSKSILYEFQGIEQQEKQIEEDIRQLDEEYVTNLQRWRAEQEQIRQQALQEEQRRQEHAKQKRARPHKPSVSKFDLREITETSDEELLRKNQLLRELREKIEMELDDETRDLYGYRLARPATNGHGSSGSGFSSVNSSRASSASKSRPQSAGHSRSSSQQQRPSSAQRKQVVPPAATEEPKKPRPKRSISTARLNYLAQPKAIATPYALTNPQNAWRNVKQQRPQLHHPGQYFLPSGDVYSPIQEEPEMHHERAVEPSLDGSRDRFSVREIKLSLKSLLGSDHEEDLAQPALENVLPVAVPKHSPMTSDDTTQTILPEEPSDVDSRNSFGIHLSIEDSTRTDMLGEADLAPSYEHFENDLQETDAAASIELPEANEANQTVSNDIAWLLPGLEKTVAPATREQLALDDDNDDIGATSFGIFHDIVLGTLQQKPSSALDPVASTGSIPIREKNITPDSASNQFLRPTAEPISPTSPFGSSASQVSSTTSSPGERVFAKRFAQLQQQSLPPAAAPAPSVSVPPIVPPLSTITNDQVDDADVNDFLSRFKTLERKVQQRKRNEQPEGSHDFALECTKILQ